MEINKRLKTYTYTLKILSPVHIGTNEDFIPTNYVITKEGGSSAQICDCGGTIRDGICLECGEEYDDLPQVQGDAFLYTFSPKELKTALTQNERLELLTLSKQTKMNEINSFFKNRADKIAQSGQKKAFVSREVFEEYRKSVLTIEKQYTDVLTNMPVILGSSLKGSLRTALVNFYAKGRKAIDDRNLEKEFLSYKDPTDDPFRYVKISDARVKNPVMTHIVKQVNKARTKGRQLDTRGNMIEIIPSGSVFEGTITYVEEKGGQKPIKDVSPATLTEACQYFYQKEFENESVYGKKCINTDFYERVFSQISSNNGVLTCIGKHSGAENVTVDGNRKIRVKGKEEPQENATTMWVSREDEKEQPFGWAILEIKECK